MPSPASRRARPDGCISATLIRRCSPTISRASATATFLLRIEDIDPGRVARRACRRDLRGSALARPRMGRRDRLPVRAARPLCRGAGAAEGGGPGLSLLLHPRRDRRRDRRQRRAPHGPDGPLYPGTCRRPGRSPTWQRPHAWRLDVAKARARAAGPLSWLDGHTEVQAEPERVRRRRPRPQGRAGQLSSRRHGRRCRAGRHRHRARPRPVRRDPRPPAAPGAARPADAALSPPRPARRRRRASGSPSAHGAPTLADLRAGRRRSGGAGRGACARPNCRLDIRSAQA